MGDDAEGLERPRDDPEGASIGVAAAVIACAALMAVVSAEVRVWMGGVEDPSAQIRLGIAALFVFCLNLILGWLLMLSMQRFGKLRGFLAAVPVATVLIYIEVFVFPWHWVALPPPLTVGKAMEYTDLAGMFGFLAGLSVWVPRAVRR
jgi:uncharacterized membrane protein YvlD (DUF360 family)